MVSSCAIQRAPRPTSVYYMASEQHVGQAIGKRGTGRATTARERPRRRPSATFDGVARRLELEGLLELEIEIEIGSQLDLSWKDCFSLRVSARAGG